MARTHSPDQMLNCFRGPPLRAINQREIVMSVSSILVACECLVEMSGCLLVFTAAIVREAQSNVCGCKALIAFQGFFVSGACLALLALLIKGHSLYVSLFSATGNLWIRKGARRGFEVGIAINWRIRAVFNKLATIFAFEGYSKRLAYGRSRQLNRGAECFCWVQLDP